MAGPVRALIVVRHPGTASVKKPSHTGAADTPAGENRQPSQPRFGSLPSPRGGGRSSPAPPGGHGEVRRWVHVAPDHGVESGERQQHLRLLDMVRTRAYRGGRLDAQGFALEEISERLADPDVIVWLDLHRDQSDELARVSGELGLHKLAVEDALHERQRPKLDRYDTHLFLSAYAVDFDRSSGELLTSEIAVFVLDRALITVRKDDQLAIDEVVDRWDASQELVGHGVSFLLYGLLDYIVDKHFAGVQDLDEAIEDLEDLLFEDRRQQIELVQRRSFELRKSLVLLRRVVLPMREVLNTLLRRDLHVVDDAIMPFYQDVYDHVLRASEWTESLRDLVTTILETNLTIQGNRMNLIMKKVTSWAAIIAVPTAITGFYGQNLPYPGFGKQWGFAFSTGVIIGLASVLFVAFKRWDWL
jgi:magnesium transporter